MDGNRSERMNVEVEGLIKSSKLMIHNLIQSKQVPSMKRTFWKE